MKLLIKLLLFIIAAILAGLLVAQPAIANSPTIESSVINPPYGPYEYVQSNKNISHTKTSGRHSTRAEKQVSAEKLKAFLGKSPLGEYAEQILVSPYWSTIIGICWIEQYHCTKAPGNNYWGIMCGKGRLCQYETIEGSIEAISSLLSRYESRGKDTIEELNGYYVQPASANWFNTVLKIKHQVENL